MYHYSNRATVTSPVTKLVCFLSCAIWVFASQCAFHTRNKWKQGIIRLMITRVFFKCENSGNKFASIVNPEMTTVLLYSVWFVIRSTRLCTFFTKCVAQSSSKSSTYTNKFVITLFQRFFPPYSTATYSVQHVSKEGNNNLIEDKYWCA